MVNSGQRRLVSLGPVTCTNGLVGGPISCALGAIRTRAHGSGGFALIAPETLAAVSAWVPRGLSSHRPPAPWPGGSWAGGSWPAGYLPSVAWLRLGRPDRFPALDPTSPIRRSEGLYRAAGDEARRGSRSSRPPRFTSVTALRGGT